MLLNMCENDQIDNHYELEGIINYNNNNDDDNDAMIITLLVIHITLKIWIISIIIQLNKVILWI